MPMPLTRKEVASRIIIDLAVIVISAKGLVLKKSPRAIW
jgi:hypothetical protein